MAAASRRLRLYFSRAAARPFTRELLILLAFTLVTALMTWPWVTRLKDAVVDPGDPYLVSWILWWDYYQTFHDPLHLFNANIFYPLPYTLAFSENDYGIALLFFPLFALGFSPLTVNSVATFLGFAFCGYGAFRLTRTLTGSNTAAWVAGLVFAFIPYRFHLLSQLHYVFTGWMPLMLEALVLFARERSRKRAAWLAVAFTMNALSCVTWFILSLTPLGLSALFLVVRYRLARDRDFWVRGALAAGASVLALLPFLLPYHYVSRAYDFTWSLKVVEKNSATPLNWLIAEYRNHLWKGFGDNLAAGGNYRLFPGLLPLLLSLAAVLFPGAFKRLHPSAGGEEAGASKAAGGVSVRKRVAWLDALAVAAGTVAFVSAGWGGSQMHPLLASIFGVVTPDRALLVVAVALLARLSLAYPQFLNRATGASNLIETIRASPRGEAFWLGAIWVVTGFLMSLGTNSWAVSRAFRLQFPLPRHARAFTRGNGGLSRPRRAGRARRGEARGGGGAAKHAARGGDGRRAHHAGASLRAARRSAPLHAGRVPPGRDHAATERDADARRAGGIPDGRRHAPAPLHAALSRPRAPAHQRHLDLCPAALLGDRQHVARVPLPAAARRVEKLRLLSGQSHPIIGPAPPRLRGFLIRRELGPHTFHPTIWEGEDLYALVSRPEAQSEALCVDANYGNGRVGRGGNVNLLAGGSTHGAYASTGRTGDARYPSSSKTRDNRRGVFVGYEERAAVQRDA